MKLVIWNEYVKQDRGRELKAYPMGLHNAIKSIFDGTEVEAVTATLGDPDQGLPDSLLNSADVLIWWGHLAHDKVSDALVDRIEKRVHAGMGIVFLHSAHFSKVMKKVLGTSCSLRWREDGGAERVWTASPTHPIATGIPQGFRIPHEEMYGEHLDIPKPDDVVFLGWFKGGEAIRAGCTFTRGEGRVFYFQPGHETFPVYRQAEVRQVIKNAVLWAGKKEPVNDFKPNPLAPWVPAPEGKLFKRKVKA